MIPTRTDLEDLAHRQREARAAGQIVPLLPADWGLTGADLTGADLRGADLRDVDLTGADLRRADLRDVDFRHADLCGTALSGARIAEGVVAASVAGRAGDYCWHALRLEDCTIIIQYGRDRGTLETWRTRGPEYGDRYGHPPEHWITGRAVAIAAAEALAARP